METLQKVQEIKVVLFENHLFLYPFHYRLRFFRIRKYFVFVYESVLCSYTKVIRVRIRNLFETVRNSFLSLMYAP